MDIRTLQYFVTIVECGNFSIAAKKLHMTQPPLSKQIQNLESELDVLLMERGPRNITLTDAGKKLYEYAQSMIALSNIATQDIRDFSNGQKGQLRIGCASSCSSLLLSVIAKEFSIKYPDITYQIFEKNTFELIELLNQNIIEVALLRSPFPDHESLQSKIIMKERFVAVASSKFVKDAFKEDGITGNGDWSDGVGRNRNCENGDAKNENRKGRISKNELIINGNLNGDFSKDRNLKDSGLKDNNWKICNLKVRNLEDDNPVFDVAKLSGKPVILYRRWEAHLKSYFKRKNILPKYLCSNDDARTSLAWAKAGMGIALLPSSTVYNMDDDSIICQDIDPDALYTDISIAWKKSSYMSRTLENFIHAVRAFPYHGETAR